VKIGVLTGGGDAPGLNAAIRAVGRRALLAGHEMLGIRNGWAGLIGDGDIMPLERPQFSGILPLGGTMLGSSRVNPMKREGGREEVLRNLERAGVDALVAIGGDDTLSVAAWLASQGAPVVGVPKTMDNDLSITDYCIGFDSAVSVVTEALDRLHTTASSHHRVMVCEVMGRDTGWVAVMGGLAGGADMIIIPEFPVTLDEVVAHLDVRRRAGSDFSIIVVAEGVQMDGLIPEADGEERDQFGHVMLGRRGVGDWLTRRIEQLTGHETRATVLGHVQRGGSPSAYDRIWATRVGAHAYDLAHTHRWGDMPVVTCGAVDTARIADVVAETRRVPRELYELAQVFY
jgi:phosphofructokinase-like protein